jgi:hypothetical protein
MTASIARKPAAPSSRWLRPIITGDGRGAFALDRKPAAHCSNVAELVPAADGRHSTLAVPTRQRR